MIISSKCILHEKPFRYSVISAALDHELSYRILDWLETDAPWCLRVTDFYEQLEFSFADINVPAAIKQAFSPDFLRQLRSRVAEIFDVQLCSRVDMTAHLMISGQRIRIHNDFIDGQESHRLLLQLNRGWPDENGGALVLFNSDDPNDVHRILRPNHNTGLLFEISLDSLHAVTPINAGQRYTLVYSFFQCEN